MKAKQHKSCVTPASTSVIVILVLLLLLFGGVVVVIVCECLLQRNPGNRPPDRSGNFPQGNFLVLFAATPVFNWCSGPEGTKCSPSAFVSIQRHHRLNLEPVMETSDSYSVSLINLLFTFLGEDIRSMLRKHV